MTTYHLGADDLWDICEPLVLENSHNVLSVLRKVCSSEYFCFFVFVLKFRQLQSHASDIGNLRPVSSNLSLDGVLKSVELVQNSRSAYQDLMKRRQVTRVCRKISYFGQQRLQAVQDLDVLGAKNLFRFCTLLRVWK